jgi:hypothetical protein
MLGQWIILLDPPQDISPTMNPQEGRQSGRPIRRLINANKDIRVTLGTWRVPILRGDPLDDRSLGHLSRRQFIPPLPGGWNIVQAKPAARQAEKGLKRPCQFWVKPISHVHTVSPLKRFDPKPSEEFVRGHVQGQRK